MGESPACLHHAVLKENEWSLSRPCAVCIMARVVVVYYNNWAGGAPLDNALIGG